MICVGFLASSRSEKHLIKVATHLVERVTAGLKASPETAPPTEEETCLLHPNQSKPRAPGTGPEAEGKSQVKTQFPPGQGYANASSQRQRCCGSPVGML